MNQQAMSSQVETYSQEQASSQPLPFSEAVLQLPRQYIKVLCRPSLQTFREELGKASWGIVLVQLYLLIVITVTCSYLAHRIPSSALHTTAAFTLGPFRPFAFLPSPYNGMAFILGSFVIGLCTAYLFSKLWHGRGRFLAHIYSLLLCTVPLVTISGALLLIPASGSFVLLICSLIFAFFVYRTVLHIFVVMAVHGLSGNRATLIVLIIPMCFVAIALLVVILASFWDILAGAGEAAIGSLFDFAAWLPERSEKERRD